MNDMIEIRDLNKGDVFIYNGICYEVTCTYNHFYAKAVEGYGNIGILGCDSIQSKLKVELISKANENTYI
jgi:hypothetical protein